MAHQTCVFTAFSLVLLWPEYAGTEEALDPQVLLDPLEEQLDLPAARVQRRDGQGGHGRVVGQEDEGLARHRGLEAHGHAVQHGHLVPLAVAEMDGTPAWCALRPARVRWRARDRPPAVTR